MAKRCECKALMDVLDEARMRTLPPDTRMLWLDITRMMQRDGISVLRFGSQPVKPNMLSRLVFRPETETETELETKITELCERGLLAREPDGAISCPMLMQATTRSEINKINGSKGGRPRKDGQPPGQRHLLLPIDGGVAMKTEKTKLETEPGEIGSSINNKDNKESFDLMKTGSAVLDAAGIDPVRWMGNYQPVANWLRLGATPEMIVEVVVEVMARSPKKPEEIHSLGYFEAAVKQRIAQQPQKKPDYEKAWQRAYDDWEITGRIGPAPRVADFRRGEAA